MTQNLTILFDLDGTLVDTAPDLVRAHNHVMKKYGFETKSVNEIKSLVGMGARTMMGKTLWSQAKEELKTVKEKKTKDKMVAEFINFYGNNILVESKLIDGVKDFLIWCKENNISMGVCTNKQEHLSVDLLKKIKIYDFFDYVAGGNTFNHNKPDPKHLTDTIEIMGGDINKTLMIGDSETDSNASKAANIPFILIEDGYTEKKTNEIYHDYLVKDFVGLEAVIKKYL